MCITATTTATYIPYSKLVTILSSLLLLAHYIHTFCLGFVMLACYAGLFAYVNTARNLTHYFDGGAYDYSHGGNVSPYTS